MIQEIGWTNLQYAVFVDDNYHYMDPDERYKLGDFDNLEAAISACKKIVDDCLAEYHEPGMTAVSLYRQYTFFGSDPFITGGDNGFSAWGYAKKRSEEICATAGRERQEG